MAEGVIRELDSIEAVRERFSLFISNRGKSQLIIEVFSNGCDESLAGRNNFIDVFCKQDEHGDNVWHIRDFGNGIPLLTDKGTDGIISVATKLYSGGKYDNEMYKNSAGANGMGLCVTNSLSKRMTITTLAHDKDNNHWRYYFKEGRFITKQLVRLRTKDGKLPFSTEVQFVIDDEYFESKGAADIDEEVITHQMMLAKHIVGDSCTIRFNGKIIEDTYLDAFKGDNCIDFVSFGMQSRTSPEFCRIDIALYDDFDSGKIFKGIVNTLECSEGTHKNVVQTLLKNKLTELVEKNKKYVQQNDIFVPIRINCVLQLMHTDYQEQVKNTLAIARQGLVDLIEPVIDTLLKTNKDFFMRVLDKAEEYRVNLESNRKSKQGKRGKTVQVEGLFECSSRNPDERHLYLVEGKSAGGNLLKVRNPKTDSVLALRGKVLNVVGTDKKKVSNKEILSDTVVQSIATTLGYKIFGEVDPKKCRYRDIFIVSDADPDGRHICTLLITAFYTLFPELIAAGKLYIVLCPLFGAMKGKDFIPIFDLNTREEYSEKGYTVRRFKGLGEMSEFQLYQSAINGNFRRCLKVQYEDLDMKDIWCNKLGIMREETYAGGDV